MATVCSIINCSLPLSWSFYSPWSRARVDINGFLPFSNPSNIWNFELHLVTTLCLSFKTGNAICFWKSFNFTKPRELCLNDCIIFLRLCKVLIFLTLCWTIKLIVWANLRRYWKFNCHTAATMLAVLSVTTAANLFPIPYSLYISWIYYKYLHLCMTLEIPHKKNLTWFAHLKNK